jgi:mono/diheme cytochrome c family protein
MFRRRIVSLVAIALVAGGALLVAAFRPRAATPSVTREALASTFEADLRHVVYAWEPADPRTAAERRRALFDFLYETYDASAWIPQSLFDSNLVTQAVVGDVDTIVGEKVGLVLWRDNARVPAFGMAPNADASGRDSHVPLRWTVNCLVCHTAEIDGVAYLGAGTKTFDELWLGEALKRLTSTEWGRLGRQGSSDAALAADAHRILNSHHHDKIDSLTRARSTAFAASHVELYMRPHDGRMPRVEDVGRGDVKTPPLWHTAAKMPAGRWYTDGSFHGPFPLMASSMELEKDRPFDALVQVVVPRIKQEFDAVVQYLRPPPYPYAIDQALAARGRELFYSPALGCSRCHGVYDGRGHVAWPAVHTDVGTDRSRRDVVSEGFIAAFNDSPLAAEGRLVASEGYAATPLTGVWADFPYLHNGSVPTLYHLLGPAAERPAIFQVTAARRFDRTRVGQVLYASPRDAELGAPLLLRRFGGDRDWFNTARPGCGNAGHDFWYRIKTDDNRRALIEYLKTL